MFLGQAEGMNRAVQDKWHVALLLLPFLFLFGSVHVDLYGLIILHQFELSLTGVFYG